MNRSIDETQYFVIMQLHEMNYGAPPIELYSYKSGLNAEIPSAT